MQNKNVLAVLVALVFLISSFVVLFTGAVYQGTEAELKSAESNIYASRLIKVQFNDKFGQEILSKYNSVLNDPDKMLLVISRERTVDSFLNVSRITSKYIVPPRIITSKDLKSLSTQKCIKSIYLSDIILSSQYIKAGKDVIVPFTPLPYDFLKGLNLPLYSGRLPETTDEIVLTYRGAKALFGDNFANGKIVYGTDPLKTVPFQNARFSSKYHVCGILKPLSDEFFYVTFGESGGFSILPDNYIPLAERPSFGAINNRVFFPEEELFVLPEKGQTREAIGAINAFLQKFHLQQEEIYPKILTTYRSLETIMSTGAIRNKLKFIILVGIFLLLLSIFDSAVFTNLLIKLRQREITIKRAVGASTGQLFHEFLLQNAVYTVSAFFISLLFLILLRHRLSTLNIGGNFRFLIPIGYSLKTHPLYIGLSGVLIAFLIIITTFFVSVKIPFTALYHFPPMSPHFKKGSTKKHLNKIVVALLIAISVSVLVSSSAIKYYTERKIELSEKEVVPEVIRILPAKTFLSEGKTISISIGAPKYTLEDYFALRDALKGKALVGFRHSVPISDPMSGVRYAEATPDMNKIYGFAISKGHFIEDKDIGERVCVVGAEIARKAHLKINSFVSIHAYGASNNLYRVIGIADKSNSLIDNTVFYAASKKELTNEWFSATKKYVGSGIILIKANNPNERLPLAKEALTLLNKRHPDKNPGVIYDVEKYASIILISATSLYSLLSIFILLALLSAFLSLSALLFIEVIRRTREIGIKKAIGATAKDITREFTMNGLKTTLIALVIGIPIGIAVSLFMEKAKGWNYYLPINILILVTLISLLLGLIFSYLPALFASKTNPVEAIKSE